MEVSARVALALAVLALAGCGGGGGAATLPLGKEAVVGYTQPGTGGPHTTLAVTVLRVRQGTQEELKQGGLQVDPKDRSTTPYYVDVRYGNRGQAAVKRGLPISLEDSKGNLISSTLIFDFGGRPFEPCKKVDEGKLAPGQSYESCTLFLVPEGVHVGKVSFLSDEGPGVEPKFVYWDAA
jgi:hypothetical protein